MHILYHSNRPVPKDILSKKPFINYQKTPLLSNHEFIREKSSLALQYGK